MQTIKNAFSEAVVDALEIRENQLRSFMSSYYSFLIPYTSAAGAIIWTVVTKNLADPVKIFAGIFIVGLTIFHVLWLFTSYNRLKEQREQASTLWEKLKNGKEHNPFTNMTGFPERIFIWFILIMGLIGAMVCFIA